MAETVQITMPQMGESVSEGTVLTWHKQEGDWVDKDETIVEVSTDKVDAEVPAPAAGKLVKILAQEDETVAVGQAAGRARGRRGGGGRGRAAEGGRAAAQESAAAPAAAGAQAAPPRPRLRHRLPSAVPTAPGSPRRAARRRRARRSTSPA